MTLGTRPDAELQGSQQNNSAPHPLPRMAWPGKAAGFPLRYFKKNYVNSTDCIEIKTMRLKSILMKINDLENINTGVATTYLKIFQKNLKKPIITFFFFKPSDGGNKEQMLAEVAVRRAEEIKHLMEASGFLFQ